MIVRSRRSLALAVLLGLGAFGAATSPFASGQESEGSAAQRLRGANERLAATRSGLADAQRQLTVLVARVQKREAKLADAQNRLIGARVHLSKLQRREATAKRTLAAALLAQYKSGRPQLVTIVLASTRFSDLYQRLDFYRRMAKHNARILGATRDARADVAAETRSLQGLWTRYSKLAQAAVEDRERADALRNTLLVRERTQLVHRNAAATRLASVRASIARIERRRAAAARVAASAGSGTAQAPPVGDAGSVVGRVVAAANQIASTPYVWGGGHGGATGGYDCSGSVSYALAAGGLLSSPLTSGGFMSWGEPGPGAHITIYTNPGHMFMVVDGRRYDTSALSGGGTRWTSQPRSTAGFVARHPPGL